MLNLLEISIITAIIGWVYAEVLIKPGMILHPIWKWLCVHWLLKTSITDGVEIEKESWFYKPLGGCFKCVTGQLALWSYIAWVFLLKGEPYHVGHHVFTICLSILISIVIEKILNK